MIQKIVDGICEKLNETFGDGYKIYTESVKQGLKEPCFIIQLVNPVNTQLLGKRVHRENLFDILYIPATNEPKAECYQMIDDLYVTLEYISVDGDLQRGTGMRGEFVEGVLHFFVNYNMVLLKTNEEPEKMEVLELSQVEIK